MNRPSALWRWVGDVLADLELVHGGATLGQSSKAWAWTSAGCFNMLPAMAESPRNAMTPVCAYRRASSAGRVAAQVFVPLTAIVTENVHADC